MQQKIMRDQESLQKEVQEQKQTRSLDFSLKCVGDLMDNLKINPAKTFENKSGAEVSRQARK